MAQWRLTPALFSTMLSGWEPRLCSNNLSYSEWFSIKAMKPNAVFFKSCWQKPCASFIVFVYGVANFLAFVGETTYSVATIAETPEADNRSEYFRAVTNGTLRAITMLMCGWWIISANKARTTGMKVAFVWILLRAVCNVAYAYGCVLFEKVNTPEDFTSFLDAPNTFSRTTRLSSATGWLLVETFVLSRMHAFYCLTTAPDYWQTHRKEETLAVNDAAAAVTTD